MDDKLVHHLLWERMRLGDQNAFFDLYKSLYYELVNFGIRTCGDSELAGEAADQVFISIWEKHHKLARVDNVAAYLRTFLKRRVIRLLERKRKLDSALLHIGAEGVWEEMSYEEFIIRVQTDDLIKYKLKSALEKLTFRQKQLVHLKFFEGLSYEQIAEQTQQSIKTAYNTVYDALKVLRKELRD